MARRKLIPKPKRGYGNGSVHEEKEDSGRWIAELDGVRRRAKSREEAEEKLRLLQELRDHRVDIGKSSQLLGQWLTIWLSVCLPGREKPLKARTLQGYAEIIRLYITPYRISQLALETVSAKDIRAWLAELKCKGLSGNTRANAFRRLRTALADACREKLIAANPADEVEEPDTSDAKKPVVLGLAGVARFLAAWEGHRLYALFATAITIGLRPSELLGLRWQDVDLDARTICVQGQLHRLKVDLDQLRKPVWVDSTKTPAGQRTIHFPPEIADIFVVWRELQQQEQAALGLAWPHGGYLFTTLAGTPLNKDNIRRDFKKSLRRAGLPDMTRHDLRHSAASLMLAQGEDIEAVKEVIGHSSRAVLERIYAHALPENKRRAGESLGFLLRREDEEKEE
ncbi:MAG: site-specific integrase [Chloroflexales bacterium]|nr:site-specific integrase [Chloroflexales bacterium]